jgi:hypothetical protein
MCFCFTICDRPSPPHDPSDPIWHCRACRIRKAALGTKARRPRRLAAGLPCRIISSACWTAQAARTRRATDEHGGQRRSSQRKHQMAAAARHSARRPADTPPPRPGRLQAPRPDRGTGDRPDQDLPEDDQDVPPRLRRRRAEAPTQPSVRNCVASAYPLPVLAITAASGWLAWRCRR